MDPREQLAQEFIRRYGGYSQAVDVVTDVVRQVWRQIYPGSCSCDPGSCRQRDHVVNVGKGLLRVAFEELASVVAPVCDPQLCRRMLQGSEYTLADDPQPLTVGIRANVFRKPLFLQRELFSGIRPDHELRYFVMRNIRRCYGCARVPELVRSFHTLAEALNRCRQQASQRRQQTRKSHKQASDGLDYCGTVWPELARSLAEANGASFEEAVPVIEAFLECCRAVGYVRANNEGGLQVITQEIEAEFLLGNLFGLPTRIAGFDGLFGGGGIGLSDGGDLSSEGRQPGRVMLVTGRFGTGKTLLALQLAAQVARVGGLAWVSTLEQSPVDFLYMIEAMNCLPRDVPVDMATSDDAAAKLFDRPPDCDQGGLVVLRGNKSSLDHFLLTLTSDARRMAGRFPLRLIVVDSLNTIYRGERWSYGEFRTKLATALDEIRRLGTNIVLISEEDAESDPEVVRVANIVDAVVRLSVQEQFGYTRRFIEVTKSRLHREQRGRHPYSIVPGQGFHVYPSTGAVSARITTRRLSQESRPVPFGVPGVDQILGDWAISTGDVIVLRGPGGTGKTPLGVAFLFGSAVGTSLLVCARDTESAAWLSVEQQRKLVNPTDQRRRRKDVRICSLPLGFVSSGLILQRIEDEIVRARREGQWIDRVMVDDVAHWELSCPYVRKDVTFGDTLVELLRRHGMTSVFVCTNETSDAPIQRPIVDCADCIIDFAKFEFRGTGRVSARVTKTRGCRHRREPYEIPFGIKGIDVVLTASLLRLDASGEARAAPIRLLFDSDSTIHDRYNERFGRRIASVLSPDTRIDKREKHGEDQLAALGAKTLAVDELVLAQRDEHELSENARRSSEQGVLCEFPMHEWEWDDVFERMKRKVIVGSSDKAFVGVPYFADVGLLAYRMDLVGPQHLTSWEEIADQCDAWMQEHPSSHPFFDYPRATDENFNVLFFEILLTLCDPPERHGACRLIEWLQGEEATRAGVLLWRVGRAAFQEYGFAGHKADDHVRTGHGRVGDTPIDVKGGDVRTDAVVWRHWYGTLNDMLSEAMTPEQRKTVAVGPLPGGRAVAGEWYLCVPAYSAAPEVGLKLMKMLTSRAEEIERLQLGVGLPVRRGFYFSQNVTATNDASPFFSMDLRQVGRLVERAFQRSTFDCYGEQTTILAHNVRRLLSLRTDDVAGSIEMRVRQVLDGAIAEMEYARPGRVCETCRLNQRCGRSAEKSVARGSEGLTLAAKD